MQFLASHYHNIGYFGKNLSRDLFRSNYLNFFSRTIRLGKKFYEISALVFYLFIPYIFYCTNPSHRAGQ